MAKVIRLSENDLINIIKKTLSESEEESLKGEKRAMTFDDFKTTVLGGTEGNLRADIKWKTEDFLLKYPYLITPYHHYQ